MAQRYISGSGKNADLFRELEPCLFFNHAGEARECLGALRLNEQAEHVLRDAAHQTAHGQHTDRPGQAHQILHAPNQIELKMVVCALQAPRLHLATAIEAVGHQKLLDHQVSIRGFG
ncbi:hypothetical protein D3C73_1437480 [compost metagenome]